MLDIAGAVSAQEPDAGVAAHYGNPFQEQRALAEEAGFVDRGNRDVIAVTGADRLSWLHTLTTQDVERLPAGRGAEALILSPQGRIVHHMLLAEDGETTWLDVEPGRGAALLEHLEKMRFLLRVEPVEASEQWCVLSLLGPRTPEALEIVGVRPAAAFDVQSLPGGGWARRMPWPSESTVDLLLPREQRSEIVDRLVSFGVRACGVEAYEALRVAARRPRLGLETDDRTIAQEPNWLESAVELGKGCYPGQEAVAKVHNMGQPPRRMVLLHLDGSTDDLPAHGAPVLQEEKQVGFVGTAVRHYEEGTIALALVKRTTEDDAVLTVDGSRAAIDPVPARPVDAGGGKGAAAIAAFRRVRK